MWFHVILWRYSSLGRRTCGPTSQEGPITMKSKRGLAIATALFFGVVNVASAAPQCYHVNEIEADQAMRYQEKLMVLSDSCRSHSYNEFVQHNAAIIASYQHQLIEYFRRADRHRPEDQFDRFLTRLANQYALGAGQQRLDFLCRDAADLLTKAPQFAGEEFHHFVVQQAADARKTYLSCTD
jgi:hypothetical protein